MSEKVFESKLAMQAVFAKNILEVDSILFPGRIAEIVCTDVDFVDRSRHYEEVLGTVYYANKKLIPSYLSSNQAISQLKDDVPLYIFFSELIWNLTDQSCNHDLIEMSLTYARQMVYARAILGVIDIAEAQLSTFEFVRDRMVTKIGPLLADTLFSAHNIGVHDMGAMIEQTLGLSLTDPKNIRLVSACLRRCRGRSYSPTDHIFKLYAYLQSILISCESTILSLYGEGLISESDRKAFVRRVKNSLFTSEI